MIGCLILRRIFSGGLVEEETVTSSKALRWQCIATAVSQGRDIARGERASRIALVSVRWAGMRSGAKNVGH